MKYFELKSMSLCLDFIDRARWTWNHIKKAHSVKISPTEETITEMNLTELQIKHPLEITTCEYNKYEESKTGADWDWDFWLGSRNFWLRLGIQAKKLHQQTLRYKSLNYKPKNSPQRQIDLLIQHSINSNPPKIPIYVFYNYWEKKKFNSPWLCGTFPKSIEMLGCAVSEATTIRTILNRKSDKLKDIANVMYPWSCLVCCRGFSKKKKASQNIGLPSRAFNFILGAFGDYIKETDFPVYERDRFIQEEAPEYVYKIMEGRQLSDEEWIKTEANRITVIYENEENTENYIPFIFR